MALSRAYQQILLQGSLLNEVSGYQFGNFKLELMDKKSNSTGLQIADLTARPIGNHYLHTSGQRETTDQRAAEILLKSFISARKEPVSRVGMTCFMKSYKIQRRAEARQRTDGWTIPLLPLI